MDELVAVSRARKLVAHLTHTPIEVAALLAAHGLHYKEKPLDSDEAGRTFTIGSKTFVVVNENDEPYRRRFTALHELGHHVLDLPSRHDAVPSNELERFAGRPIEERLCDAFAAECLVPSHLIRPIVAERPFTVDLLIELSDQFEASKQCIASCYVRNSPNLVAYVYSEAGRVHHVLPSAALRTAKIFIDAGMLPRNCGAAIAATSATLRAAVDLDTCDWSSSDAALTYSCYEEALHGGTWDQSHSLLTFERVADGPAPATSELDEDELLPELSGYLSWEKR